jgi:hypothetical protein
MDLASFVCLILVSANLAISHAASEFGTAMQLNGT